MRRSKSIILFVTLMAAAAPSAAAAVSLLTAHWTRIWEWDTQQQTMIDVGHQSEVGVSPETAGRVTDGDVNGDGQSERVTAVWRRGRFGPIRPRWIQRDTVAFLPHVDVTAISDRHPLWQSSAIDRPACALIAKDMNRDQLADLIVLEGGYQQNTACRGRTVAVWFSTGWGFQLAWRSAPGRYEWMAPTATHSHFIQIAVGT